jgi:hypothetical protein
MLQTVNGKIVTGIVEDSTGIGTLGKRVFTGNFLSNYLASNPGFYGLRTGDAGMPPGAAGFPAEHDVGFDLLPMTIGPASSNLFYWNGTDSNGNGPDLADVNFVVPAGITWSVRDDHLTWYVAHATGDLVPGGVIDRTSTDVWPDPYDSGAIHNHMALQLSDNDGDSGTSPAAGVYMISFHARSLGFSTSDPFFFVFRTSTLSNSVRDVAAQWVEQHLIVPGDYNGNGAVDAADYILWRNGGPLQNEIATPNAVTPEDYTEWRARFGQPQATGTFAHSPPNPIPEPSLLIIVLTAILTHIASHRMR